MSRPYTDILKRKGITNQLLKIFHRYRMAEYEGLLLAPELQPLREALAETFTGPSFTEDLINQNYKSLYLPKELKDCFVYRDEYDAVIKLLIEAEWIEENSQNNFTYKWKFTEGKTIDLISYLDKRGYFGYRNLSKKAIAPIAKKTFKLKNKLESTSERKGGLTPKEIKEAQNSKIQIRKISPAKTRTE